MHTPPRSPGLGLLYRPLTLFKWIVYLALPVMLWVAAHVQLISDYFTAQALRNRNRAEVAKLEARLDRLAEEKKQLQSGGFLAEKAIRERYKMTKPREKIIIIEEEPPQSGVGAEEMTVQSTPSPAQDPLATQPPPSGFGQQIQDSLEAVDEHR